jgi:excisionase family DNA binding protein
MSARDRLWQKGRSVFVEDAAALLGVSRRTIYYRIREGRLRTIRTVNGSQRVLVESIEALLRERAERDARRRASKPKSLALQVQTLS